MNSAEKRRRSSTAAICRSSSSRPSVRIEVSRRVTLDSIGTLLYASCRPKKKKLIIIIGLITPMTTRQGLGAPPTSEYDGDARAPRGADRVGRGRAAPLKSHVIASASQLALPTCTRATPRVDAGGARGRRRGVRAVDARPHVPLPGCEARCRRLKMRLRADETALAHQPCCRLATRTRSAKDRESGRTARADARLFPSAPNKENVRTHAREVFFAVFCAALRGKWKLREDLTTLIR